MAAPVDPARPPQIAFGRLFQVAFARVAATAFLRVLAALLMAESSRRGTAVRCAVTLP